jgi:ABC-type sulfate transport system permease subunit
MGHHQARFPGKRLLTVVIELPFSVSPIVAGVAYLFVYGLQGLFGPALQSMDDQDPLRAAGHRAGQRCS